MRKTEKLILVGYPFFLGLFCVICGTIASLSHPEKLQGAILICTGIICISVYCVCSILARIAEK